MNGQRTIEEIATRVTQATDWIVTTDNVRHLLQSKLIPLGFLDAENGSVMSQSEERPRSPLKVNMRRTIFGPHIIDRLSSVFQVLYMPRILIPILLVAAIANGWWYFIHGGVGDSVRTVLYMPGGILLVLMLLFVSGIFHELGHAAALYYGGGKARGIGVGLYLLYPVFYTDATDSYRLGRWARVRTDLGGIYFDFIFTLGLMALYFISGQEILLAVVVLIGIEILYNLLPFVRLDGYWVLADLTGIPDFFSQMRLFLGSLSPGLKGKKLPSLKPWVKVVFTLYTIFTIPLLTLFFLVMFLIFPRFMMTSWDALFYLPIEGTGSLLLMAGIVSQLALLVLSMLASIYFIYSTSRTPIRVLWNWSRPTRMRRLAGASVSLAFVTLLGFFWTPVLLHWAGRPIPVQRYEITERSHVETPVSYPQAPPVGGNHAPIWQNCGFYDTPIANEHAVHSLEHGAVWVTYRPDLPEAQIERLRQLAHRHTYILVSPFPDLPAPVVVSAWGHQSHLASIDDPRLDQFVSVFRLGRQAPERGEPCTGGVGTPKEAGPVSLSW
jgi:putative peptide zinc metalloprotease protein